MPKYESNLREQNVSTQSNPSCIGLDTFGYIRRYKYAINKNLDRDKNVSDLSSDR